LEVERLSRHHAEDGRKWIVELHISLGNSAETRNPPPYEGLVRIRGFFEVHADYPNDPRRLIEITGASILYGAAREMLANMTARSSNGIVSLPSVAFHWEPDKKSATKKRAAPKKRKKTVKKSR